LPPERCDNSEQTETAAAQKPAQWAQFETKGLRGLGSRSRGVLGGTVKHEAAQKPAHFGPRQADLGYHSVRRRCPLFDVCSDMIVSFPLGSFPAQRLKN
jgi:hypothetical protein